MKGSVIHYLGPDFINVPALDPDYHNLAYSALYGIQFLVSMFVAFLTPEVRFVHFN